MKTTELCESLCKQTIEDMGFTLCEVEFQKEYSDWVLTFFIDKEGGVTIDDCENVSRALEPILDEADPIEQAYYLSVSSLGLDRPLKKDADYERNLGKELEVRLYAPIKPASGKGKGIKELVGVLKSYDAEAFTLVCGEKDKEKEYTILRKDAALVRPYIDFSKLDA